MKKAFFLITFLFLITIYTRPVEAHFLAVDRKIGAVLHVEPNDDPVAGSQASFFFEFKDTQNKFQPGNCDCTFSITENGNKIFSQVLFQNSQNPSLINASVFYTFPQRDVYLIKVVGKPLSPDAFQSFTLTWNFRVDQQANPQDVPTQSNNFFVTHLVHFIGIGVAVFCFFIYLAYKITHKKNSASKGGEKNDVKEDNRNIY